MDGFLPESLPVLPTFSLSLCFWPLHFYFSLLSCLLSFTVLSQLIPLLMTSHGCSKQGSLNSWICLPQTNLLSVGDIISKPWAGSDDLWPGRMGSPTILHVMFMVCTGPPTRGMVQEKTGTPNIRGGSSEDIKQKEYY